MNSFDPDFASPSEWARLYRMQGIQVVPGFMPNEHKSWKRPLLKSWTEFQEALIPDEVFLEWYGPGGLYASRLNMGVICGHASNNTFVIDLDIHKHPGAAQWWQGLLAVHNNAMELETVEQRTGGGGLQKLFHAPANWNAPTNKTSLGVDIRGQGGFAMLCPSLHESGQSYQWLAGRSPAECQILMAPDWLLEAVEEVVRKHGGGTGTSSSGNGARAPGEAPQGRYDSFGALIDSRETYMRDLIYAAFVGFRLECPIAPGPIEERRIWDDYERNVQVKQPISGESKVQGLEREKRGPTTFHVKWLAMLAKWDSSELAEAVKEREARARPPAKPEGGLDFPEARIKPQPEPAGSGFILPRSGPVIQPGSGPLIQTSAEFLAAYTPPAYLIDGVIQRGYLYSLTARTGHGKTAVALYIAQTIARGKDMHGCKVLPGTVLILAGENPDDVRARYFVLGEAYGFDPAVAKIRWIPGVKHLPSHMDIIRREAETIADLVLVIVDTAAAYFPGTETNSNSEQGAYARLLRELTFLKGKPATIALCHPVKNAARDNLLPLGGSAFVNEVDGNLTLWSGNERQTVLHWQGKFRGPEFDPLAFEMAEAHCNTVKDESGRLLPSVVARPMSQEAVEASEDAAERDEDRLLRALYEVPRGSLGKLGERLGWKKRKVQTLMDRLAADKLAAQVRNKKYEITDKGRDAIGALKDDN